MPEEGEASAAHSSRLTAEGRRTIVLDMPVGKDGPPPSPEEAARALARWPEDVEGLRSAWEDITAQWRTTDERARSLGDEAAHQRVADEWSYVETSRHLVFVIDLWIRRAALGESTFRAEGLPPTFMPAAAFPGVDAARAVSLERAIDLRNEAEETVRSLLGQLDDDGLARPCGRAGEHTVLRCLKTVCNEADLHRQFAARDLAVLESTI